MTAAAAPADRRALTALVAALPGARVVGTGDVMLDRFVEGGVGRISPEAPVPVLKVEAERVMPGGAGNVLANLAALGARTRFVSVVGADPAGAELTRLLEALPGAEVETVVDPGRATPVKTRFVAAGQQLLRADRETTAPLGRGAAERVRAAVEALLLADDADVLFLSDYAKGTLTPDLVRGLIAAAARLGKPVLVDPKGRDLSRYRGALLLKPNRAELALATGRPVSSLADALAAGRELMAGCGCANLLVTLGADGVLLLEQGGGADHIPGLRREVFDVGGAGDTVLATLAAAVAVGVRRDPDARRILRAAAELANVAGAVAVGRRGTATVGAADLQRALVERELLGHEAKVLDRRSARELIEAARARRGARIGFTNGCFDILHPGHVTLLARARAACDLLVVGVNSDDSVRRLKGPGRPVNPEQARCLVLASLASVDAVVVFEEDTPLELIEEFRPDLLVKGADYTLDRVVGAELVRSWGGEVMLAEIVPGFSTTGTLARIGAANGGGAG